METKKSKFTVAEALIVVIVLAIVVMSMGPRFSFAGRKNEIVDLCESLQKVRQAVVLYRIQHQGLLPGRIYTGADITEADFIIAMTTKSDSGYGPYLKSMPVNPYNGLSSVVFSSAENEVSGAGWNLDPVTGHFRADDSRIHMGY